MKTSVLAVLHGWERSLPWFLTSSYLPAVPARHCLPTHSSLANLPSSHTRRVRNHTHTTSKNPNESHLRDSGWSGSNRLPSIMAKPKSWYYVDFTTFFESQIMKLIEFNWIWHIYVPKPWKMLGLEATRWLASMRWMFVPSKAWNCIIHKVSSFAEPQI